MSPVDILDTEAVGKRTAQALSTRETVEPRLERRIRVRVYGQWLVVPDDAVVTEPNRFGPTVVWPYNDRFGNRQIRCFMPGTGT